MQCSINPKHKVFRWGKQAGRQIYYCKDCKKRINPSGSFKWVHYPIGRIAEALTLYYNGMSFSGISNTFKELHNLPLSKSTLWQWVIRYTLQAGAYINTLKPQVGDEWYADETVIDIGKEKWWYWDIIDEHTRYLLATHLSRTRGIEKAKKVLKMAKARAGKTPLMIRTDVLEDYFKAIQSVFGFKVIHSVSKGFSSSSNINLIERFHGSIKQRTKVIRDFKSPETASIILDGFVAHYNFVKPHRTLKGVTPAFIADIAQKVRGWEGLICSGEGKQLPALNLTYRTNPQQRNERSKDFHNLNLEDWK